MPKTHAATTRRQFLSQSMVITASAGLLQSMLAGKVEPREVMRAAIIGHTGHGNFGHDLDTCLDDVEGVTVVAVADPDEAGRARAASRSGAARQYGDYRQMLERERPQLVVVAPRWSEEHRDMALAALEVGAHLLMEKPISVTLAEADEVLAAAARARRKVAVAHQMRLAPAVVHLKKRIDEGLLGDLLRIVAYGKQDSRAGGEDMLVLGVHLFDLMRMFAGDPLWCTARIQQGEHDITVNDAHRVKEGIGPVAGDTVEAQYAFPRGVSGMFVSRAGLRRHAGHWGMTITGTKGSARILADIWPSVFVMTPTEWGPDGREENWRRLPDDPTLHATADEKANGPANHRVVDDWLSAIREDREPTCSGLNGAKALEMVTAAYQAALRGARVKFPLTDRSHPLLNPTTTGAARP